MHTLLAGPWRSAGFAGPESIVVPAAALAPGQYTVQLTATQPSTTFTLQVGWCRSSTLFLSTWLHVNCLQRCRLT